MKESTSVIKKLEQAKQWVQEAGQFLRENLAEPLEITEKTRYDDLVTNYDKAVQKRIISKILQTYPKDFILAEEDEKKVEFSEQISQLWVLDPIDGTTNFIVQKDDFAIMLAYFENGVGKFGIILDVMNEKLYWSNDHAAFCNEKQLHENVAPLHQSLLAVNAFMYRTNTGGLLDLSHHTLGVRSCGSAGISYTKLLDGKIIGYFSHLQVWDYAAGMIISEKLGFVTKALDGENPHFNGREMVYTVPKRLLGLIQEKMQGSEN